MTTQVLNESAGLLGLGAILIGILVFLFHTWLKESDEAHTEE